MAFDLLVRASRYSIVVQNVVSTYYKIEVSPVRITTSNLTKKKGLLCSFQVAESDRLSMCLATSS